MKRADIYWKLAEVRAAINSARDAHSTALKSGQVFRSNAIITTITNVRYAFKRTYGIDPYPELM